MLQRSRRRRARRTTLIWLVLATTFAAWSARAAENTAFAAGTDAFAAGNYAEALQQFRVAITAGDESPALRYNVGVSQYRLGDFAAAEATFADLALRYPEFRAVADYNRGLALLALGEDAGAASAFASARANGDERLASLAGAALAELGAQSASVVVAEESPWSGYADARLGHDDNVALVDELVLAPDVSASSPLVEAFGYAARRLHTRAPLRLDFSGYVVRYPDASDFDQNSWRAAAVFERQAGSWRLAFGPQILYSMLDGDGFERAVGVVFQVERDLGANARFDVRAIVDDVAGASSRFDYLDGTRERVRLGIEHGAVGGGRLRAAYDIESQDRAAANVSPERRRIGVSYARRVDERWTIDALVAVRSSRYDGLAAARTEHLREATIAGRRDLPGRWALGVEYRYADNDSSLPQYGYRSDRVTVGMSRSF